jgi:hypothetical protein
MKTDAVMCIAFTNTRPSATSLSCKHASTCGVMFTKPQPSRALIESACHQIEFGIAETAMLYKAVVGGEQYNLLLRWGYQIVSRAMSSNEIMTALQSLALSALAVGWVACESGVQSALLNQLVSTKASSGLPETPNDGSGKPRRGKAGKQSNPLCPAQMRRRMGLSS